MTEAEFSQVISSFFEEVDMVKGYKAYTSREYEIEVYTDLIGKSRSQIVYVKLMENTKTNEMFVNAYSIIGEVPNRLQVLIAMLRDDVSAIYSRLGILKDKLVVVYRYPLHELESGELTKAIYEIGNRGDFYENRYYGGRDKESGRD